MRFSDIIIPLIFAAVLLYGCIKKSDVFSDFISGVKDGLKTVYEIFPSLFCLVVAISVFRASGGMEIIGNILTPVLSAVGFPPECSSLLLLRPFSGSGSIALFEQILSETGADSFPGRVASVILGSSETTFYTISVYFAATKVKKTRYALPAALCGDFVGFIVSAIAVRLILG